MSFKARYFPVSTRPLRMSAGLFRFGTDFGQAERDHQFFHVDLERERYLLAKRHTPATRRVFGTAGPETERAISAALDWMRATLAYEAPQVLDAAHRDGDARDALDALARNLSEDFCVFCAGDDFAGRAALVDIRLASGFRPERLRDADFAAIHGPVPGFPADARAAQSMVRSMIERGPFVRFVWTLCPDARLDRHPDVIGRPDFRDAEGLYLRVERQVTVPLTAARASLFLIRVYIYPFAELTNEQQQQTLTALEVMPDAVRAYKHLPHPAELAQLLAHKSLRSGDVTAIGETR